PVAQETPVPQTKTAVVTTPAPTEEKKGLWGTTDWSGRINLGASLQRGNSETESINADASAKARWKEHRISAAIEYNRAKDAGTVSEDNRKYEGQYDYFFTRGWFANTSLGLEQDAIAALDLRTTVGLALGHQAYEGDDLNLQYKFGPTYLHENFDNAPNDQSIAGEWSLAYDQRIWKKWLQIFHEHNLFVPADDGSAWLADSKTGVRVPIKDSLTGTAEVDFDWDNAPAPGTEKGDTTYALKLGYEW
ncbi:MAG: DUF481 domain-containing protein, partial [Alphaproteobacteria bacterium]|nr:DUF481 domain-containing protein [Alphaproteobacteria bacterium]